MTVKTQPGTCLPHEDSQAEAQVAPSLHPQWFSSPRWEKP